MTDRPVSAEAIAEKFVAILREWLTSDEWQEMRRRNANERHPDVCHSHDFVDANMAMGEAFEAFGLDSSEDLWNEAWNIAMPALTGD